ncbi:MAG: HAD family hydrolase [Spartobacteria bacterium]|nr:HAD family hydrolase [Spartobacteria bacterium]
MDITVVFFDIDGTLLETGGAGKEAFQNAITKAAGAPIDISHVNFAGATDLDLFRNILAGAGRVSDPAKEALFFQALAAEMEAVMDGRTIRVFPGVQALLDALSARPEALVGLVTGNIDEGARIKLAHAGLHGHFMLGAFGCEHADRMEIARLALRRAEQALLPGQRITRKALVGDTPSDMAAARAVEAVAIGVATGRYTLAQLRDAGADHVVANMSNLTEMLSLLFG